MQLINEFTVGVPIEVAWAVLTDLEGIGPCLPGERLETTVLNAEGEARDISAPPAVILSEPSAAR